MSSDMARLLRFVVVIGILVGSALAIQHGARLLLERVEKCDQPCRWSEEKGYIDAHPLDLHLEIKTTRQPLRRANEVWYRADFMNRSCETLFLSGDFMVSDKHESIAALDRNGIYVLLQNESRAEPPLAKSLDESIADVESDVHPYQQAPASFAFESIFDVLYLKISPGQTISASPTILAPYRIVLHDRFTPAMILTVAVPEPVSLPNANRIYTIPPQGFRKLQTYAALPPGKYSAQLVIRQEEIWVQPHYSYFSYPKIIRRALLFAAYGELHGNEKPPLPVKLDLTSPTVVFAVRR